MDTHTLSIAVCEDDTQDAALLDDYIKKTGIPADCRFFISGEDFLRDFCGGMYDLIFMDIYMKGIQGTQTVEAIRRADPGVTVAFCTSSPDHTRESYKLKALWYLDKPISAADVKEILNYAVMKKKNRPAVTITMAGGQRVDIAMQDIMYLEHKGHIIQINTTGGIITTSQSARLDDLEKQLPCPPFLRCHRSYLVNLDYVYKTDKETYAFIMQNKDKAYIRRGKLTQYDLELKQRRLMKIKGE